MFLTTHYMEEADQLCDRLAIFDHGTIVAEGTPAFLKARVSVAAVERNYTNWARGGTFNPSGQVRIPSLRGDGTGFFGATVVKTMTVIVPPHPSWPGAEQLPACG